MSTTEKRPKRDLKERNAILGESLVVQRSVRIHGHNTSVSLELPFWEGLRAIAAERRISLSKLMSEIENTCSRDNFSSAVRLFVLNNYQERAAQNTKLVKGNEA
jgi:predicted DNA-binding ribbon-helix-helix protein